jgi:hypothetical protein
MLSALIGIVGVVLGIALTTLRGSLADRRRRREDAKADARLLLPELAQNVRTLDVAITFKRPCDISFGCERWERHQRELMRSMGEHWTDLAAIYTAFSLMEKDRVNAEVAGESELDGDLIEYMLLTLERTRRAIDDLGALAGLPDTDTIRIPEFYGV